MSLQVLEHSEVQLRHWFELMVAEPQLQLQEQNFLQGGAGAWQLPEEEQV